jgi:hypothetical protein
MQGKVEFRIIFTYYLTHNSKPISEIKNIPRDFPIYATAIHENATTHAQNKRKHNNRGEFEHIFRRKERPAGPGEFTKRQLSLKTHSPW